jgi:flagellar basal-body rod protein FlgG
MLTELVRQDALSSDLANASTPGYKPEVVGQASFGDVLLANTQTGQVIGSVGGGTAITKTMVDMTQGSIESTGAPLDVALEGPGFLAVQTAQGTRYTRNGELAVDAQGRLTNSAGNPVLDPAGKTIAVGAHAADLSISTLGVIAAGGKTLGTIGITSLTNPAKLGNNLFTGTVGAKPTGTTISQGSLEGSAVNPTTAMIDMIVSLRAYESSQKVIHSIDETLSRGIDSAGSVGGS